MLGRMGPLFQGAAVAKRKKRLWRCDIVQKREGSGRDKLLSNRPDSRIAYRNRHARPQWNRSRARNLPSNSRLMAPGRFVGPQRLALRAGRHRCGEAGKTTLFPAGGPARPPGEQKIMARAQRASIGSTNLQRAMRLATDSPPSLSAQSDSMRRWPISCRTELRLAQLRFVVGRADVFRCRVAAVSVIEADVVCVVLVHGQPAIGAVVAVGFAVVAVS